MSASDTLPLTIEHQRIYILPTRRGWAFLAVLLLMLLASVNYGLSLGYALSFLLTGLFAASLLHTYRNLAGLQVQRIDARDTFAGEPARFTLTLSDPAGRARNGITVHTRDRRARSTTELDATASAQTTLEVATQSRGTQAVGRLTLSSDWPIGLWRAWSYVHAPRDALVYPAPEPGAPPLPQRAGEDGEAAAVSASDGDVAGLRAYKPGDAPARIAWKSAARSDTLQVRLMEQTVGPAHTALDLASTGLHEREARLSRLCAWVLTASRQGAAFSLALPGGEPLEHAHGAAQQQAALQALALFETAPRGDRSAAAR